MPTARKRHTITETPNVERALAPLRASGVSVNFSELVIKGAGVMLDESHEARASDERRRDLRRRFLSRSRQGAGIDLDIALRVREEAWVEP